MDEGLFPKIRIFFFLNMKLVAYHCIKESEQITFKKKESEQIIIFNNQT